MKVRALCLTKNEADIIRLCLEKASEWADTIYVIDNGSEDGSWELVQSLASKVVVPWAQLRTNFQESLRGLPFNFESHGARAGDWWCRLDADEFYVSSPRAFLESVPRANHVVFGLAIEYYLTRQDAERIDFNCPVQSILKEIRGYRVENSEPRFFRHREGLRWTNQGWPTTWVWSTQPASSIGIISIVLLNRSSFD